MTQRTPKPSAQELQSLYESKTDREIALLYSVTDVAVSKWRKRYGIQTKTQLDRLSRQRGVDNDFHSLTAKELADLYSKMGQRAIARKFGISKPTVVSRLKKLGVVKEIPRVSWISGDEDRGAKLSVEEAKQLILVIDPKETDAENSAYDILRRTVFPVRELDIKGLDHDWQLLIQAPTRIQDDILVSRSIAGVKLCNSVFTYREDATRQGKMSLRQAWSDEKSLRSAIRYQIKCGDPLTPHRVRNALSMESRAPTNFMPCFAKALVDHFCPVGGTVLDPCAGYGGRAAGTRAAGRQYVGVDPHPMAKKAYDKLQEIIGPITFHNEPFEDVDLGDLCADLILTSPPYYSVERYSDQDTQSWVRYPTWDQWLEGFLDPMTRKMYQHLTPDGLALINIKNITLRNLQYPLADKTIELMLGAGFKHLRTMALPLGQIGPTKNIEPILIFKKA